MALVESSIEYAKLQAETGIRYKKDKELYAIWQYPPYRVFAMNLIPKSLGWMAECSRKPTFGLGVEEN